MKRTHDEIRKELAAMKEYRSQFTSRDEKDRTKRYAFVWSTDTKNGYDVIDRAQNAKVVETFMARGEAEAEAQRLNDEFDAEVNALPE